MSRLHFDRADDPITFLASSSFSMSPRLVTSAFDGVHVVAGVYMLCYVIDTARSCDAALMEIEVEVDVNGGFEIEVDADVKEGLKLKLTLTSMRL